MRQRVRRAALLAGWLAGTESACPHDLQTEKRNSALAHTYLRRSKFSRDAERPANARITESKQAAHICSRSLEDGMISFPEDGASDMVEAGVYNAVVWDLSSSEAPMTEMKEMAVAVAMAMTMALASEDDCFPFCTGSEADAWLRIR